EVFGRGAQRELEDALRAVMAAAREGDVIGVREGLASAQQARPHQRGESREAQPTSTRTAQAHRALVAAGAAGVAGAPSVFGAAASCIGLGRSSSPLKSWNRDFVA